MSKITPYGFEWGPMEVTRLMHAQSGERGLGWLLEVGTKYAAVEIYVSDKGRVIECRQNGTILRKPK